MGFLCRSSEKCRDKRLKSCLKKCPVTFELNDCPPVCEPEICCEEKTNCECESSCCAVACCKPGCSSRKPCLACIKKGVKCVVIPKCKKEICMPECPKKCVFKTRCEIKDGCCDIDEPICCTKPEPVCCPKPAECPKKECEIDCCKLTCKRSCEEVIECKTGVRKSASCRNIKACPCASCKVVKIKDCCDDEDKCCRPKRSCSPCKPKCVPEPPSCPKPFNCVESCSPCDVFDPCDNNLYVEDASCCEPKMPSNCWPSCGSYMVPQITRQTSLPCPCGSRKCGNPVLIFQQAIQSPSCLTPKRFP